MPVMYMYFVALFSIMIYCNAFIPPMQFRIHENKTPVMHTLISHTK